MPPCNRSCPGQRWVFRSTPLGCARGAIALPMRQQKRTWALELRTRARPGIRSGSAHVGTGAHAMQPNTAQQHARGATRTGIPGDPWVCSPRGGRGVPARAWLGLISAAMEVNSHLHPRAHVHANADITDMRMPGRECSALELNPPRALLLARRQCDGRGGNRDLITPGYAPAGAMITR